MLARSNHGIILKFGSLGVVLKHIYENTSHDIIWYLLVGYNDRHRWNTCRLLTCCSFMFFRFSSATALFLSARHFSTVGNLNHSLVHEVRRVAFHGYWQRRGYGRMFVSNLDYPTRMALNNHLLSRSKHCWNERTRTSQNCGMAMRLEFLCKSPRETRLGATGHVLFFYIFAVF